MEQVLQLLDTVIRVVLVGMFALTPGIVVWLVLAGIMMVVRRVKRTSLHPRVWVNKEPAVS